MKESPNYYAVIPASVRYADITPNAKLLYGELTALCSKEGYCWAGNSYFAKLYDVHSDTITSWIAELRGIGVIEITVSGPKRSISLVGENAWVGRRKDLPKVGEKTGHNNTRSITSIQSPSHGDGKDVQEVINLFKDVNPSYGKLFANKTQRAAVSRLLVQWPRPKLDNIVAILPQSNGTKYAPVITTPLELEDKMGKLIAFIQSNRKKGGITITRV